MTFALKLTNLLFVVSLQAQQIDWINNIKNKPFFDVRTYGAKCDGVTNDAPAVQTAVNAAQVAGGGVVSFPCVKINFNSAVYITAGNITLQGLSMMGGNQGTWITQSGAGSVFNVGTGVPYAVNNVIIQDMRLATGSGPVDSNAIYLNAATWFSANRVWFGGGDTAHSWHVGVYALNSTDTYITDCWFSDTGGVTLSTSYGVYINGGSDANVRWSNFLSNGSTGNAGPAGAIYTNAGVNASHVQTYEHGHGIVIDEESGLVLSQSFIDHCTLDSGYRTGSQGVRITAYTASPLTATSSTSLAIALGSPPILSGSITFTTQTGLSFFPSQRARVTSAANANNYMEGIVQSYTGTSLVIFVDAISGSGTHSDWTLTWPISYIGEVFIDNTWIATNQDAGVYIFADANSTIQSVKVNGGEVSREGAGGIIANPAGRLNHLKVTDVTAGGNSQNASNTYADVYVGANVLDAQIQNNTLGNLPMDPGFLPETGAFGIAVINNSLPATEAQRTIVVTGNKSKGHLTDDIYYAATNSNSLLANNIPSALGATTALVPATVCSGGSPCTLPATPTASASTLYVSGGTVSTITRGGVNVCTATPCIVPLPPNGQAIVTYSVIPTGITLDVQ